MGLIKAGLGAVGGVLADQWKEFFYCDAISENILCVRGEKQIGKRSSNTKGNDNVISNGSKIAVADGQCMLIVEQGKVVEVCAEPGEFIYDSSTEPSIFAGSFGESVKESFKTIGKRFTFGGSPAKDQRVYYLNTKEIVGNKFGTASPIPFKVVINEGLNYRMSVDLRFNGTYSYKITDPVLFYTNVCGNVEDEYDRERIDSTLKAELIMQLQPALAVLSASGVYYDQIPAHNREIRDALNAELRSDWGRRGIEIYSMNFGVPSIPDNQRQKLTEWEETAMARGDIQTMAAHRAMGETDAMKIAAGNSGGAVNGFMGMGMMGGMAGGSSAAMYAAAAEAEQRERAAAAAAPSVSKAASWKCPGCGKENTGKFCAECGAKCPDGPWKCPNCGKENTGKFCDECGTKKPDAPKRYKCNNCGWEPEDPANPPKFCPECGNAFNS